MPDLKSQVRAYVERNVDRHNIEDVAILKVDRTSSERRNRIRRPALAFALGATLALGVGGTAWLLGGEEPPVEGAVSQPSLPAISTEEPPSTPSTITTTLGEADSSKVAWATASAAVDGEFVYTFDLITAWGCQISNTEFRFGFHIGRLREDRFDPRLVGSGEASGSEWRGRMDVYIRSLEGTTNYFSDFSSGDGGALVVVDGETISYSGEWQVLRPGASEPEPAGNGSISVNCP